jgi:hypothetical protein
MTKSRRSVSFAVVLSSALVGQGCAKEGLNSGGPGTGGASGTGGAVGTGGTPGTGGVLGTGGAGTGGALGTGGAGTGGALGTGGTTILPDAGSPPTCTVGGITYQVGETFKRDCNTCTCTVGGAVCTEMACLAGDGGADVSPSPVDAGPAPDGLVVCTYNGTTLLPGESVFDGCNTCSCGESGVLMCTARACPVLDAALVTDSGSASCTISSNLTFGHAGGMVIYQDRNRLTATTFTITRTYLRGVGADGATSSTCSPELPACGAAGVVSVATINADLADPDVQAAFKTAVADGTLYGSDPRPADGTVYSIALDDGRTLLVGGQCASPAMSSCRTIPAGLVRLTEDLMTLAAAMAAVPACGGL